MGGVIEGVKIISFKELIKIYNSYDVILSFHSAEVEEQFNHYGIPYWNNEHNVNCYFDREDVLIEIDNNLLWRYQYDTELKNRAYITENGNWFRKEFCSKENEELVEMMRRGETERTKLFLEGIYSSDEIYEDEYYKNRPGMRLVKNILLSNEKGLKRTVLDLGCGHGELMIELKKEGFETCGVDQSIKRVQYLQKMGMECIHSSIEDDFVCDKQFDVVVCQECLEHVMNPIKILEKIKVMLKLGGSLFISVPYGKNCESVTHVRQFDENKLYTLLTETGYKLVNIIKMPYLNYSGDVNLFVGAKRL